jgi:hypothetical protein
MRRTTVIISAFIFGTLSTSVLAKVPDVQTNRLGNDLTPLGAEKAGEGDIPAWTGGLSTVPANVSYKPGDHLPDPFASDPIKYTITPQNMAQYDAVLTDGYKALLKAYPDYKMNVYQSRRSCAYPEAVYQATKNNSRTGELVGGGNGVDDAIMGTPFPIPNSALEILWNHTLRYRAFKLTRQFASAPVTSSGDYTLIKVQDEAILAWSDPSKKTASDLNNTSIYYIANTIAPAREAGNVVLVYESLNAALRPRQAWQYSPGTRRVRRAPNIAYDNPGVNTDGLATSDSFDGYNGAPDRYDWTVIDKAPRVIVADAYKAYLAPYKSLLKPKHVNQDLVRYELHRVWEYEGKLKANTRHVYSRRVYHNDEDSWQVSAVELYDGRGQLWRVQEIQSFQNYAVPLCTYSAEINYDLQAERYLTDGMQNEEPPINFSADELDLRRYTPEAIRQLGVR